MVQVKYFSDFSPLKSQVPTGGAIAQKAPSLLKCKYIIHAVGPIYQDVKKYSPVTHIK